MNDWKESRKRKYVETVDLTDDSADLVQKPECKYGSKCYRKNLEHLAEFSHPSLIETKEITSLNKKDEITNPKYYFTSINDVPNAKDINKYCSISLSEILDIDSDQFVESVQLNFMIDYNWLISQYPAINRSKPMLIIDGGGNKLPSHAHLKVASVKFDNPYGKHHTKMMFLLYETGMRVVIHTANMIEADWHQKTNGVWISELFPRLDPNASKASNPKSTDSKTNFRSYLIMYLEHYEKKELKIWIDHLKAHNTMSANVFLIGSVPGRFSSAKKVYGLLRLQKVLQDHFNVPYSQLKETYNDSDSEPKAEATIAKSSDNSKLDRIIFQFSSIGSLGPNENSWLCSELKNSMSECKNKQNATTKSPICIYPTINNVLDSFEGVMAGGSLPYFEATASKQRYLENFLYVWKANSVGRTRCMPHIKSFARYSNDFKKLYWFLLTSANLSKAAWGKLEKNNSQIFIMSYEMGVLFLPSYITNDENKVFFDLKDKNDFVVPYDLPPVKYNIPQDKPWCM